MIGSLAFDGAAANANRSLIRDRSPHKREAYSAHVTWTPSVRVSAEWRIFAPAFARCLRDVEGSLTPSLGFWDGRGPLSSLSKITLYSEGSLPFPHDHEEAFQLGVASQIPSIFRSR